MRRLVPFAEVVARVERLAGGGALSLPSPAAAPRAQPLSVPARSAAAPVIAPASVPPPSRPTAQAVAAPPQRAPIAGAAVSGEALLAAMLGSCRPTLAAPLRSASAQIEGDTFVLQVPPDFVAFASMNADEYRELLRKAAGRPLALRVVAGGTVGGDEQPGPARTRRSSSSCASRRSASRPCRTRSTCSRDAWWTSERPSPGRNREPLR